MDHTSNWRYRKLSKHQSGGRIENVRARTGEQPLIAEPEARATQEATRGLGSQVALLTARNEEEIAAAFAKPCVVCLPVVYSLRDPRS
jgi:hypothetical protein